MKAIRIILAALFLALSVGVVNNSSAQTILRFGFALPLGGEHLASHSRRSRDFG